MNITLYTPHIIYKFTGLSGLSVKNNHPLFHTVLNEKVLSWCHISEHVQ